MSLVEFIQEVPDLAVATILGTAGIAVVTVVLDKRRERKIINYAQSKCGYQVPKEREKQLADAACGLYNTNYIVPNALKEIHRHFIDQTLCQQLYTIPGCKRPKGKTMFRRNMSTFLSHPTVRDYILNS